MKVITVTLNPAYDIHYTVDSFRPFEENYASAALRDCGGKGINISKMLNTLSVSNTAYAVLGKDNCSFFNEFLSDFSSECKTFYTDGSIRENITLHCVGMKETRISADSFSLSASLFDEIAQSVSEDAKNGAIVAFSGRLPRGIEAARAADFLCALRESGVLLALDSNSFSKKELLQIKPWLIKPNEQELSALFSDYTNVKDCALELCGAGIQNVLVTLGEQGCVFAGGGKTQRVHAAKINPISTIGAGDSTIGGFIAAFYRGLPLDECVRFAVACGSAACTAQGTQLPDKRTIEQIYSKTKVEEI